MTLDDAEALIAGGVDGEGPAQTWAELGSGDGTFTQALARLLPAGSIVHAIDRDRAALRQIPATVAATTVVTQVADFTQPEWPNVGLDGVLLANSLHYVSDQPAFLRSLTPRFRRRPRLLIVEYDTDRGNPWVPYPISQRRLRVLAADGGWSVRLLGSRPSMYRRAAIYAALVA